MNDPSASSLAVLILFFLMRFEFISQNTDVLGGINPKSNLVSCQTDDRHCNIVTQTNSLTFLARKHQHIDIPLNDTTVQMNRSVNMYTPTEIVKYRVGRIDLTRRAPSIRQWLFRA